MNKYTPSYVSKTQQQLSKELTTSRRSIATNRKSSESEEPNALNKRISILGSASSIQNLKPIDFEKIDDGVENLIKDLNKARTNQSANESEQKRGGQQQFVAQLAQ